MTKYVCDRCEEEMGRVGECQVSVTQDSINLAVGSSKVIKYDLCKECKDLLDLFLKKHE